MKNMKEFLPGSTVRGAHDARIVGREVAHNPYWYRVAYPDGHGDVVNISRVHWYADEARATMDHDGSVQVISSKLTPQGAMNLFHWLDAHYAEFEAVGATTSPGVTISG